jgi:hypothetical protein
MNPLSYSSTTSHESFVIIEKMPLNGKVNYLTLQLNITAGQTLGARNLRLFKAILQNV